MPRDKFATPVELSKVERNHGQKKWLDSDSASNGFKDKRLQQRYNGLKKLDKKMEYCVSEIS